MNFKKLQDKVEILQTYEISLFIGQSWSTTLLNISNALLYFKKARQY